MLQPRLHDRKTIDQSRCRDGACGDSRGMRAVRGGPHRHGLSIELEPQERLPAIPRAGELHEVHGATSPPERQVLVDALLQALGASGGAGGTRPAPARQLHGRYRWLDCLHYHRLSSGTIPFYRHRSWIRNERTGGEIVFKQDLWYWGIEGIAGDGSYDWGSTLFHIRPRRR
jgi:hypothetical protein